MAAIRKEDEYRQFAALYDTLLTPFVMPIRREVCRMAQEERLKTILDLCCGTGQQSILLDRAGFSVTGVDLSDSMLRVAHRKSPPSITYFREDAAHLHFEAHSFDGIVLSFALHEKAPDTRRQILQEVHRVLKEGGTVLIVDFLEPHDRTSRLAGRGIALVERLAGADHYANYRHYMRHGALNGLIEAAGLRPKALLHFHGGATGLCLARS